MAINKNSTCITRAITLNSIKYGESSKIVRFYTEDLGKISVLARGALGIKSNLLAITEGFAHSMLKLSKGKNFYYINDSNLIDGNFPIRKNYDRLVYGNYFLELIDKTVYENEKNKKLYFLLLKILEELINREDNFLLLAIAFEVKYISIIGYRPNLIHCINCSSKDLDEMYFSVEGGGLICEDCRSQSHKDIKITKKDIYNLNKILYSSLDELDVLRIEEKELIFLHSLILEFIKDKTDTKNFFSLNLLT